MSAVYSIFTSPTPPPVPGHLPTLVVTPHGRPDTILYTLLHTNMNRETYLLTPTDEGESMCVAKLYPPSSRGGSTAGGSSSSIVGPGGHNVVKCEASRNLRWHITQTGIQNPIYKVTLPNPDSPEADQPLFQASKPNPNAGWWTLWYFTYAGHLIPPKRVEFGRIQRNDSTSSGGPGTRVTITGNTAEEKAVWKALGDESNADMIEWIVLCVALTVTDDEIIRAAELAKRDPSSVKPPAVAAKQGSTRGRLAEGSLPDPRNMPNPSRPPALHQQTPPSHRQPNPGPPMPKPVPAVSGYPLPPPMGAHRGESSRGPSGHKMGPGGFSPHLGSMPPTRNAREPVLHYTGSVPPPPSAPHSPLPPPHHHQMQARPPPPASNPRSPHPLPQQYPQQQQRPVDYREAQYQHPDPHYMSAQARRSPVPPRYPAASSYPHPHPPTSGSSRGYQSSDAPARGSSAQPPRSRQQGSPYLGEDLPPNGNGRSRPGPEVAYGVDGDGRGR